MKDVEIFLSYEEYEDKKICPMCEVENKPECDFCELCGTKMIEAISEVDDEPAGQKIMQIFVFLILVFLGAVVILMMWSQL